MYEEKIFKEVDIFRINFDPNNTVFSWLYETFYNMLNGQLEREHEVYYKISIERFDSKEELENAQAIQNRFI